MVQTTNLPNPKLLAALLITRQVVGNIKESLIPYIKKHFNMAKLSYDKYGPVSPGNSDKKDDDASIKQDAAPGQRSVSQVEIESSFVQYEGTFEDYLEMFIQFGYVTLFSCAYPLAGFWALLNNVIEVRGDAFKLCFVHQRPFGQRVRNIGTWQARAHCIDNDLFPQNVSLTDCNGVDGNHRMPCELRANRDVGRS